MVQGLQPTLLQKEPPYFPVAGGNSTASITWIIPLDAGMEAMMVAVPFTMNFPSFLVMVILPPFTWPITCPSVKISVLNTPSETWYCRISARSSFFSGFNNPLLNGTKKLFTTFQTQTYVPGNWHGFHFSPFYNMTLGMLGNESDKFLNGKLYSIFSLGVLINNDYLVFSSFQISFSFYPSIPYQGTNVFKTNTFKNDDLTLPDFQIGEPTIVPFH